MGMRDYAAAGLCRLATAAVVAAAVGAPVAMHGYMDEGERLGSLWDAVARGDVAAVARAGRADLDAPDAIGWTPLMRAAQTGRGDVAEALIGRGADVNANPEGWTALMAAASHGQEGLVRLLLARGADVGATNAMGHDALFLAAVAGHAGSVRALLGAGADPERVQAGETALSAAVEQGEWECARAMVAYGLRGSGGEAREGNEGNEGREDGAGAVPRRESAARDAGGSTCEDVG